jgi:hypothetical protein
MQRKKKRCSVCTQERYLYKNRMCLSCYRKIHPDEFKINQSTKPIKKVSEKQKDRNFKYKRLREDYIKNNPICEFEDCNKPVQEVHHKSGRIGKSMFQDFMSVCSDHHFYIHNHPEESYLKGYLIKKTNARKKINNMDT